MILFPSHLTTFEATNIFEAPKHWIEPLNKPWPNLIKALGAYLGA